MAEILCGKLLSMVSATLVLGKHLGDHVGRVDPHLPGHGPGGQPRHVHDSINPAGVSGKLRHCVADATRSGDDAESERIITEASRAIERLVKS